jgi:very-short-patch-repair endonuclease
MNKVEKLVLKYNTILSTKNTNLRLVSYSNGVIIFNNGREISDQKQIVNFKNRLKSNRNWPLDDIYSSDINRATEIENNLLKEIQSQGGKTVQSLYGDKIRLNLNTGIPWNTGTKGVKNGTPWTEENKRKLSESRKGENNPMYGRKYTEEEKLKQSENMKLAIKSGKFTPKSNNRLSRKDSIYNGINFRSSWEAIFYSLNQSYEYEKLRIKYFSSKKNKYRIYIVDFISHINKIVVEIKPKKSFKSEEIDKIKALSVWCKENGYKLKIYTDNKIKSMAKLVTDLHNFDKVTQSNILKLIK